MLPIIPVADLLLSLYFCSVFFFRDLGLFPYSSSPSSSSTSLALHSSPFFFLFLQAAGRKAPRFSDDAIFEICPHIPRLGNPLPKVSNLSDAQCFLVSLELDLFSFSTRRLICFPLISSQLLVSSYPMMGELLRYAGKHITVPSLKKRNIQPFGELEKACRVFWRAMVSVPDQYFPRDSDLITYFSPCTAGRLRRLVRFSRSAIARSLPYFIDLLPDLCESSIQSVRPLCLADDFCHFHLKWYVSIKLAQTLSYIFVHRVRPSFFCSTRLLRPRSI